MSPTHHLPDEWLLAHAAGTQSEAMDLLTACHLTLCPECRDRLATLEDAAGAAMAALPSAEVTGLDALLAALPEQDAVPSAPETAHNLPAPLLGYIGTGDLPWRFLAPGIQQIPLPVSQGNMPVRLLHLAPGLAVPTHTHAGLERTLVLKGGYDDQSGTFVRGDIGIQDHTEVHHQHIHKGEHCIALVVADNRLVPVGVKSTLLSWFVKA